MIKSPLTQAQLNELSRLDSHTIANSIEMFSVRLRNTGFTDSRTHCIFPDLPPIVGYAATARIRTANPPMEGHTFYDRTDWWDHILSIPAPRIVVMQDLDDPPGLGSCMGEIHGNILSALGCVAIVTNGAVRGVEAMRAIRFQMFAGNLSVSHAYFHIVDFGGPIEVAGMNVQPGHLLHGDAQGVQTIPLEIASQIPLVAEQISRNKQKVKPLCHSKDVTIENIRAAVKDRVDVKDLKK